MSDINYPKNVGIRPKAAGKDISGPCISKKTDNGPHLKTGKGTSYNQAKITSGFMTHNAAPGHTQKKNIDQ